MTRRVLELIVVATILACVVLVLVELATNVRAERPGAAWTSGFEPSVVLARVSRPGTGPG